MYLFKRYIYHLNKFWKIFIKRSLPWLLTCLWLLLVHVSYNSIIKLYQRAVNARWISFWNSLTDIIMMIVKMRKCIFEVSRKNMIVAREIVDVAVFIRILILSLRCRTCMHWLRNAHYETIQLRSVTICTQTQQDKPTYCARIACRKSLVFLYESADGSAEARSPEMWKFWSLTKISGWFESPQRPVRDIIDVASRSQSRNSVPSLLTAMAYLLHVFSL